MRKEIGLIYPKDDIETADGYIIEPAKNEILSGEMGLPAKDDADTKYTLANCTQQFVEAVRT